MISMISTSFNPSDFGGVALWIDAQDAATITTNGKDVVSVEDKSSHGFTFTSMPGHTPPTVTSDGINGFPTIKFNWNVLNSSTLVYEDLTGFDWMTGSEGNGVDVFIALKTPAGDPTNLINTFLGSHGSHGSDLPPHGKIKHHWFVGVHSRRTRIRILEGPFSWPIDSSYFGGSTYSVENQIRDDMAYLLHWRLDGTSHSHEVNGEPVDICEGMICDSIGPDLVSNSLNDVTKRTNITIASVLEGTVANPDSKTKFWSGDIGEIVVFEDGLSQSNAELVTAAIQSKWNITFDPKPDCDFNNDFSCSLSDINLMFAQGDLVAGVNTIPITEKYDLVDDDMLDGEDITEWLSVAGNVNGYGSPFLPGDTDHLDQLDPNIRTVDITDFQKFIKGFHVRTADITDFQNILADFNAGTADITDFQSFLTEFNFSDLTWDMGNFNGDAVVDITDFSNYFAPSFIATGGGEYVDSQAIPEPHAVLLLGLGGVLLAYMVNCQKACARGDTQTSPATS